MVFTRSALILIIAFLAFNLSGQNCIDDNGTNSFVTPNQHPYTVFFKKQNSIFSHDNQNRAQSLDSFRSRLREILIEGSKDSVDDDELLTIFKTYEQLCALAYESSIVTYVNHKTDRHNTAFAYQLKAKAFVLLCATNKAGLPLGTDTMTQIRADIESMFNSVEYEYPISESYNTGQYASKRIIHYLQAYDLYVADAQLELNDNSKVNSIKCDIGIGLQQMIRDFWRNGEMIRGAMSRNNDNHTLMFAGVLGLASVVLNDIGDNNWNPHKHPQKWFDAALWRIDKTMWDESGRSEGQRDGLYGFAEGPYYFKYAYENVLPFFMAFKNAHESKIIDASVKPYNLINFRKSRDVESNPVDDEGYDNLFKWSAVIQEPDGDYPTFDDTYTNTGFIGLVGFKNNQWFNNPNFSFSGGGGLNMVDFREEFVCAAVDGFYSQLVYSQEYPFDKEELLDNGSGILRNNINPKDFENQLYCFLNAESTPFGTKYMSRWGHEHDDMGSFILTKGASRLLIDPKFYKSDAKEQKKINKVEVHNIIIMDDKRGFNHKKGIVELEDDRLKMTELKFKGKSNYGLEREVYYKNTANELLVIRDDIYYKNDSVNNKLKNHSFALLLNGNGLSGSSFKVDSFDSESIFAKATVYKKGYSVDWFEGCSLTTGVNYGLKAYLFVLHSENDTNDIFVHFDSLDYDFFYLDSDSNKTQGDKFTQAQLKVSNSTKVKFRTILLPYKCGEDPDEINNVIVLNRIGGLVSNKRESWQTCAQLFSDSSFNTMILDHHNQLDTLSFLAEEIDFCFDFDTLNYDCGQNEDFRSLEINDGSIFVFKNDTFFISKKGVTKVTYNYNKLYDYSGIVVKGVANDTITFYLPEVPPTNLSLMQENTGLNYSYDTTSQKITIYLPDSGTYNFAFGPSNPCAVSCFYPPDSIWYHFEHRQTSERLGHILDLEPTRVGWIC